MRVRAMAAAAQRQHNTEGLQAVAKAFRTSGEWFAAMALSHIGQTSLDREHLTRDTCSPTVG
jgi:hypothetical protein